MLLNRWENSCISDGIKECFGFNLVKNEHCFSFFSCRFKAKLVFLDYKSKEKAQITTLKRNLLKKPEGFRDDQ